MQQGFDFAAAPLFADVPEVTAADLPPVAVTTEAPPCQHHALEPGAASPWPNAAQVRRLLMADLRRVGYAITAEQEGTEGACSYTEAPPDNPALLMLRMLIQFPIADGWHGHAAREVSR